MKKRVVASNDPELLKKVKEGLLKEERVQEGTSKYGKYKATIYKPEEKK